MTLKSHIHIHFHPQSMYLIHFTSHSYSNGDLYEGFFQEGQRFGHGCYQSGRHNRASCTSIYVGEWNFNMRDGFGVQDDTLKGKGLGSKHLAGFKPSLIVPWLLRFVIERINNRWLCGSLIQHDTSRDHFVIYFSHICTCRKIWCLIILALKWFYFAP